jgi:hypothetical protein
MELTQVFLLGMMVAWTPSLIVLAVLLAMCAKNRSGADPGKFQERMPYGLVVPRRR